MEQTAAVTDADRRLDRVRPDCQRIAWRLRRLWQWGLILVWVGTLLFSVGLIGYCLTFRLLILGVGQIQDFPESPLLILLPVGGAAVLLGGGIAVVALIAELLLRARLGQFKQLLFVAAILTLVVVLPPAVVQPRLTVRWLSGDWTPGFLGYAAAFELQAGSLAIGIGPSYLDLRVGESNMGRGSWLAWPPLLALPVSLLCLPWAFFWPMRARNGLEQTIEPSAGHSPPDRDCVARRMRRMLWIAAIVLVNAAAAEALWLAVFVARWQVNPVVAREFAALALYCAGGVATVSIGAILASLTGLFLSRTWRFSVRWLAVVTALCGVCFGAIRLGLGDRLSVDHGAVIATVNYDRFPDWVLEAGLPAETQIQLPVIEPFSWLGPHSLLLAAWPFLLLPLIFKWPTTGALPRIERTHRGLA